MRGHVLASSAFLAFGVAVTSLSEGAHAQTYDNDNGFCCVDEPPCPVPEGDPIVDCNPRPPVTGFFTTVAMSRWC